MSQKIELPEDTKDVRALLAWIANAVHDANDDPKARVVTLKLSRKTVEEFVVLAAEVLNAQPATDDKGAAAGRTRAQDFKHRRQIGPGYEDAVRQLAREKLGWCLDTTAHVSDDFTVAPNAEVADTHENGAHVDVTLFVDFVGTPLDKLRGAS
jgi:hypothetical protein